jgi:hypothetical protein
VDQFMVAQRYFEQQGVGGNSWRPT